MKKRKSNPFAEGKSRIVARIAKARKMKVRDLKLKKRIPKEYFEGLPQYMIDQLDHFRKTGKTLPTSGKPSTKIPVYADDLDGYLTTKKGARDATLIGELQLYPPSKDPIPPEPEEEICPVCHKPIKDILIKREYHYQGTPYVTSKTITIVKPSSIEAPKIFCKACAYDITDYFRKRGWDIKI